MFVKISLAAALLSSTAQPADTDTLRDALAQTIRACCEAEHVSCLLDASPARLDRMMQLDVPVVRVRYRFVQLDGPPLEERVMELLAQAGH